MTDHKKPGVAFWATVVVVVALVVYPLSAGPVVWLEIHVLPRSTRMAVRRFYLPLESLLSHSKFAQDMAARYILIWVDPEDFIEPDGP